ncbi:unnamed protein product [Caenorhabditis bovis]|uniref:Uncharacterized protein n=1 Tax=Caenorhabditis bovis TaxID=2654633 RepID=A0A8S1FEB7_9PELO|nr:unnamed protein product [Caenorhabditis bovis]
MNSDMTLTRRSAAMKRTMEDGDADSGSPKRVRFCESVKEVLLEVVEGPLMGRKRTRPAGDLIEMRTTSLNSAPKKPRRCTQEELWEQFGAIDRERIEDEKRLLMTGQFCAAVCISTGCQQECPCRTDEVLCYEACPCSPANCNNYDVAKVMSRRQARKSMKQVVERANVIWANVQVAECAPAVRKVVNQMVDVIETKLLLKQSRVRH